MNEHIKTTFKNILINYYLENLDIYDSIEIIGPEIEATGQSELEIITAQTNGLTDSELLDQVILFCNEGHIASEYGIQALVVQNRSLAENNTKNMLKFDLIKNYSNVFGYDTTIELINTFLDSGE